MMTMIRTFIAIDLPDQAHTALADLQHRLKAIAPPRMIRWIATENIHLTLHFLGDIAPRDVDKAAGALQAAATTCPPFSLELTGLGCFPHTRRPRIIWAGVAGEIEPLVNLHRELGQQLKVIDFTPEDRPYAPHLTIGRVKPGLPPYQLSQLGEVLEQARLEVKHLAGMEVNQICLFQSDLRPTGPLYTRLAQAMLKSP
ncbi:MAG: RNA 2',3'-cyclic phosphodiesterase [Chloroflexota bacterium]